MPSLLTGAQASGRTWIRDPRRVVPIVGIAALAPLNFLAIGILAGSWQVGVAPDFQQYADALSRFFEGTPLYGPDWKWRYSPAAIPTLGPFLATGLVGWTITHLLMVGLIRPWWLAILFGLSWPFWVDVVAGNTMAFVATAGTLAMRGSTAGSYAYWWLSLIMPRPVQLPLALYLAWRRRDLWRGLLLLCALNVAMILIIGQGPEWIAYLLQRGAENTALPFNIHPAADWGAAWLLVGVPLAAVLTWRGWAGAAGMVLSPSLLAQYLLMLFVPPGEPIRIQLGWRGRNGDAEGRVVG